MPCEVVLGYRGGGQHPNWDALPEIWIWQHRVEDGAAGQGKATCPCPGYAKKYAGKAAEI